MKKQIKTFVIAMGLLIAVASAYFLMPNKSLAESGEIGDLLESLPTEIDQQGMIDFLEQEGKELLIREDSTQLNRVEFFQDVAFILQDDKWILENFPHLRVNQALLNAFAQQISSLGGTFVREISTDEEKKTFGLIEPMQPKIFFSNGTSYTFNLGEISPTESDIYFTVDDSNFVYMDKYTLPLFYKNVDSLLDVSIAFPNLEEFTELKFKAKDKSEVVIKATGTSDDGEKIYSVISPVEMDIDTQKLKDNLMKYVEKIGFIPAVPIWDSTGLEEDLGFNNPFFELEVSDSAGDTLHLTFGVEMVQDGYYVKYNDNTEIYICALNSFSKILELELKNIVDDYIYNPSVDEVVSKIIFNTTDEVYTIEPLNSKLDGGDAPEGEINPLVSKFKELTYDVILTKEIEMPEEDIMSIEYILDSDESVLVSLYPYENESFYLVGVNGKLKGLVSQKAINAMIDNIVTLKDFLGGVIGDGGVS